MGTILGISIVVILTHAAAAVAGALLLKPILAKLPWVGKYFG